MSTIAYCATGPGASGPTVPGVTRRVVFDFTFSNPYVVTGEAVTAASLGLSQIQTGRSFVASNGMTTRFDNSNNHILLYATYATESAAVDRSTVSCRCEVEGY